jgi:hypothetical protein
VAEVYAKMQRLSRAVTRETAHRPDDPHLRAARLAVWRAQANDAYWHGVFGGCYLPHLRRAVRAALLEAEEQLARATGRRGPDLLRADVDGDGAEEIVVRTSDLAVTVHPAAGGTVTELAAVAHRLDVADVLTRRPEAYHDRTPPDARWPDPLAYDRFRRASLLDGLFDPQGVLDPVDPWPAARRVLGGVDLAARVEAGPPPTIVLEPRQPATGLRAKRITVDGLRLEAEYHLDREVLGQGRWAVQWNLALTAGEGPDRYLDLPGRPPLRSRGRSADLDRLVLVDDWCRLALELAWSPAAEVAWGPVETVALSPAGPERLYQGTAFLIVWSAETVCSDPCRLTTALTLRPR